MLSRPLLGLVVALFAMAAGASAAGTLPNAAMLRGSSTLDRPGPPSGSFEPSAKNDPLVYLANYTSGAVVIFSQSTGKLVGHLRTGHGKPWELAVDSKHNLYVGNQDGTIAVYHRGLTTPIQTLRQAHCCASGLAFGPSGLLYATEYPGNVIDVFGTAGSPLGHTTFTVSNLAEVIFITSDIAGNLFVDGFAQPPSSTATIDEIDAHTHAVSVLQTLPTGNPGGLAVDASANLIYADQGGTLYTLAPPYTGAPTSSFYYEYGIGSSGGTYSSIALDQSQTTLWAAAYGTIIDELGCWGQTNSYPLGSTGMSTYGLYGDECYGLALDSAI